MKRATLLCLFLTSALFVAAQETAPEGYQHWTAAGLQDVLQTLSKAAASDPHHASVKQLADFPNELLLLAHREGDGQIEWHETQSDVFVVQSGSATLLIGGT